MIWHGMNHYHSLLQGALQVAAGVELQKAGRFLTVMDTLVTVAPLLGLLGTVSGTPSPQLQVRRRERGGGRYSHPAGRMKSWGLPGNDSLSMLSRSGGSVPANCAVVPGNTDQVLIE